MNDLDRHMAVNAHLETYGALLTDRQRIILGYYYVDNYTLAEIADLEAISRNAVHDLLRRTVKKLEEYERKLQLLEKQAALSKAMALLEAHQDIPEISAALAMLKKVE
ncbi:MAG: hypothetical protein EA374_05080 [Acholeplasmatales bacterium]|nr:MAG: hypothetical protein EA374_05080 [Acholeplasmatales bacterium]